MKNVKNIRDFFIGMENFTFRKMHVDEKSMGKSLRFFLQSFITFKICLNQDIGLLYRTKNSLAYTLIVYYHYRTVYNKETVTGEEILKSHVACLLTYKFPSVTNFGFSIPRMTGNSAPLI